MPTRHFIDSLEFAKQSLEIHDKIRASNLPGLEGVLSSGRGELEYAVIGSRFSRGSLALRLEVRGTLGVQCQSCLGEMDYPVDVVRNFILVADESAIPGSEIEDDEVDYLVADPNLDVEALLEEELLLGLPVALRHEAGCADGVAKASVGKFNPFQVLEGLKKN